MSRPQANFGLGTVDNGRFMAVNSYDNVLRVYDRGSLMNIGNLQFRVRHQLYGPKNKNHTIKSSFYCGPAPHPSSIPRPYPSPSPSSLGIPRLTRVPHPWTPPKLPPSLPRS